MNFGTAVHNTEGALDYVHSDVWGPSKNASSGGKQNLPLLMITPREYGSLL